MRVAGVVPLEPFKTTATKWKCKCKKCKTIVYPAYNSVNSLKTNPCRKCAALEMGARRRAKSAKANIAILKKAHFIPLEEFPGNSKPWRVQCLKCKKESNPHLSSVKNGSGCIYCAGRKVDESDVRKVYLKAGFVPITKFRGPTKWKSKHKPCGKICTPDYTKVKLGRGCAYCSGNLKVTAEQAKKLFLNNSLKPLVPFRNSQIPWKSKCLVCEKIVRPNYAKVKARGHQCSYCARNRVDSKDAVNVMKNAGFLPMTKYPGGNNPWKVRCKKCRKISSPNYSSVKAGSRCKFCMGALLHPEDAVAAIRKRNYVPLEKFPGTTKAWKVKCKDCKRVYKIKMHSSSSIAKCAYCAGIKVEVKDVYAHLKNIGLKPLEKYVNARTPIRCRCESCLRIISPSWSHLKNKKSGCAYCARRRVVPEVQIALMLKSKVRPIAPYKNSSEPWECMCLICRRTVFPRLSDVKRGQGACIYCSGRKVVETDAIELARSLGFEPLVKYPGARKGWKCRCLNCRKISKPQYTTMQNRQSGCKYCAESGFDFNGEAIIYLITHKKLNAHKIGVAGAKSKNQRLRKHTAKGWNVYRTKKFRRGQTAFSLEQSILYWLRVKKDLQSCVRPKEMPQGGSSETVDASEIDLPTIWAKVEELSRVKK